jgi:hypothetical protein
MVNMDYRLNQRLVYLFLGVILLCSVTVQAQTGAPNVSVLLSKAEQAIEAAREADADSLASVNFQLATNTLNQAQLLLAKRKTKEADRLALKSIRYAELSANESKYIQLKEALETKSAENNRLRRELLLGTTAVKP